MQQKAFTLHNRGMNRDLSVSKAGESSAYENHNIRITATDHDTLLSVTNERGNKEIYLGEDLNIEGELIGWNVLNNHIILFTHEEQTNNLFSVRSAVLNPGDDEGSGDGEGGGNANPGQDIWDSGDSGDDTGGSSDDGLIGGDDSGSGDEPVIPGDSGDNGDPIVDDEDEFIPVEGSGPDRIYRIDYEGGEFYMRYGKGEDFVFDRPMYHGNLGFEFENPTESVVYFETEDIQKIYWVDGIHVLRMLNFMADKYEVNTWNEWPYVSDRESKFNSNIFFNNSFLSVKITKDNSGNPRPNGTIQYLITYYNEHAQETGIAWVSDLVYLSPMGRGGAQDENNNNSIRLYIEHLDEDFSNFRVYSIFRSALNGEVVANLVYDGRPESSITVVDDGSHLESVDTTRLLYLGSKHAVAGTLEHKDQTLFLGDLKSTGQDYSGIKEAIKMYMYDPETGRSRSNYLEFMLSDSDDPSKEISDIPYTITASPYLYESQLDKTSSQIRTFKGGEKYRFALIGYHQDGTATPAFWIGDKVNSLYPVIDADNNVIRRVVVKCVLPLDVVDALYAHDIADIQLAIAEATYADRSIKAQGIVNPTMFNTWDRYNQRLYSMSSWISRPRNSGFSNRHFDVVNKSTKSTGEIQCNYWETANVPTPYFRMTGFNTASPEYLDKFDGEDDYTHLLIIYITDRDGLVHQYQAGAFVIKAKAYNATGANGIELFDVGDNVKLAQVILPVIGVKRTFRIESQNYLLEYHYTGMFGKGRGNDSRNYAYTALHSYLADELGIKGDGVIVDENVMWGWFENQGSSSVYHNTATSREYDTLAYAVDDYYSDSKHCGSQRWITLSADSASDDGDYTAAYYRKHLMFVDENVITLNSPEIEYGAVSFDNANLKFRIVGVAKMAGVYSDYVVNASHGKLSGENLVSTSFSSSGVDANLDGLVSWPLWKEFGLMSKPYEEDDNVDTLVDNTKDATSNDYIWEPSIIKYWLHMWNHSGIINAYHDPDDNEYSLLHTKTFATMRYSPFTMYNNYVLDVNDENAYHCVYEPRSIRTFNHLSSQYVNINVGGEDKFYDGNANTSLSLPGSHKYPILYSTGSPETGTIVDANPSPYLYSNEPVQISFLSSPHAVISLESESDKTYEDRYVYWQKLLPRLSGEPSRQFNPYNQEMGANSGALIPWININGEWDSITEPYPYVDYTTEQPLFTPRFNLAASSITADDKYLFIGEIYYDFDVLEPKYDTRYGGINESNVEACRFIPAGRRYSIRSADFNNRTLYGTQGDTYFQRWDCMKTKQAEASDATNQVIDVVSVMLETHINIDGITDVSRGTKYLASIKTEQFGSLNPAYSQNDNFFTSRVLDDDFDQDKYRSTVTWTLDKSDSAEIDEWTHITLANTLKLDGDKGSCNAIRRFQNSLIAFQDRAISEILFNSRTQLTTTDGVPVEIANSGKVDGKRYITNKYGCTNKWSIVEGKSALYFVDNINKAFCSFNGGIENLSASKGFSAWFRRYNNVAPWTPDEFDNIVAYYDRIHSDVYLVGDEHISEHRPTLVYNEMLGEFTSFFDYDSVPMMTNVEDRFISFKNHRLWLQNEGFYCNFFDTQYDYWVNYRVTPDPFGDKIWTNIDYRADFYRVLDNNAELLVRESEIIAGDLYDDNEGIYQENTTFDNLQMWNEYQKTEIDFGKDLYKPDPARKKFRIWRLTIPRAMKSDRPSDSNKYGLDRMRNPWISLKFTKKLTEDNSDNQKKDLMQLHDITVRYFE